MTDDALDQAVRRYFDDRRLGPDALARFPDPPRRGWTRWIVPAAVAAAVVAVIGLAWTDRAGAPQDAAPAAPPTPAPRKVPVDELLAPGTRALAFGIAREIVDEVADATWVIVSMDGSDGPRTLDEPAKVIAIDTRRSPMVTLMVWPDDAAEIVQRLGAKGTVTVSPADAPPAWTTRQAELALVLAEVPDPAAIDPRLGTTDTLVELAAEPDRSGWTVLAQPTLRAHFGETAAIAIGGGDVALDLRAQAIVRDGAWGVWVHADAPTSARLRATAANGHPTFAANLRDGDRHWLLLVSVAEVTP